MNIFCLFKGAEESDQDEKGKEEINTATADPHSLLNVDLSKYVSCMTL